MILPLIFLTHPKKVHRNRYKKFLDNEPGLEEVLLHADTETQLRAQNQALYYFLENGRMFSLLDVLMIEGTTEVEAAKASRCAFVACKCLELPGNLGMLLGDEELLFKFFSFFGSLQARNSVLAGYFANIFKLLEGRNSEVMMK